MILVVGCALVHYTLPYHATNHGNVNNVQLLQIFSATMTTAVATSLLQLLIVAVAVAAACSEE